MTSESKPWDGVEGESGKAFRAFNIYLQLGPSKRSYARAYAIYSDRPDQADVMPPGFIKRWAADYNWVDRARAYDQYVAEKAAETTVDDTVRQLASFRTRQLAAMGELHSVATTLLGRFVRILEDPDSEIKMTPQLLAACMKAINYAGEAEARVLGIHQALELIHEEFGVIREDALDDDDEDLSGPVVH